jgi:hypothetical protein
MKTSTPISISSDLAFAIDEVAKIVRTPHCEIPKELALKRLISLIHKNVARFGGEVRVGIILDSQTHNFLKIDLMTAINAVKSEKIVRVIGDKIYPLEIFFLKYPRDDYIDLDF